MTNPSAHAEIAGLRVRCEEHRDSIEIQSIAARRLLALGEFEEAVAPLTRLSELDTGLLWAHEALGLVLARLGRADDAVLCFRRAVECAPESRDVWHNLAVIECQRGRGDEAVAAFRRVCEIDPTDARARHDLAVALAASGGDDEARRSFVDAVRMNPRFARGRENALRFLLEHGRYDDGRKLLEWLQTEHPDAPGLPRWAGAFPDGVSATAQVNTARRADRMDGHKIAFFASSDTFLSPIVDHLRERNDVRVCRDASPSALREQMEWAGLAWFEWCDDLLIAASQLPKTCKIVCRLHSYEAFSDMPSRVNWSVVDRLIFVNRSVGEVLDRFTPGVAVGRVVIANGVDPDRFPVVRREGLGGNVAAVGYINYKKSPALLLQCFAAMHQADPSLRFHIAGAHQDPRLVVYFEELLPKLDLPITMHDWVEDMPAFYREMDIVISTSLFESFHYSIAEGMLSGCLPLVHSWKGADGVYPGDCLFDTVADCVSLMERYRTSDATATRARNRRWIVDRYDLDDRLHEIEQTLIDVLETDRRREERRERRPLAAQDVARSPEDHGMVSVVIPTYNRAEYLGEAIESALGQSYPNLEVIVCDDGSTDATPELLKGYGDRIRVVRQVNRGPAAALNTAIREARGEYIAWLSDDDAFCPAKLERQVKRLAEDASVDFVYSDVTYVNEFSDILGRANIEPLDVGRETEQLSTTNPINGCSVLFRRKVLNGVAWFDEELGGKSGYGIDGLLWLQLLKYHKAAFIDEPLVYYRYHPSNITKSIDTGRGWERYQSAVRRWLAAVEPYDRGAFNVITARGGRDDRVESEKKDGLKIAWVGATDPGGLAAMYSAALNQYTRHSCRVLTHTETSGFDSDLVIKSAGGDGNGSTPRRSIAQTLEEAASVVDAADVVVFTAGVAPGANREDVQLTDTDEEPFGTIWWPDVLPGKMCLGFVPGSPSARANVHWYHEHLAGKGWPVITCHGDLHLHMPGSRYVPLLLDRSSGRYGRELPGTDEVVLLAPSGDGRTSGRETSERLALRLQQNAAGLRLGRANGLTFGESLALKSHAHVAFDRLSVGTGHFGLSSLEHSAMGIVNVVTMSRYERALLAGELGTDELPWITDYDEQALYDELHRLVTHPDALRDRMRETREWFGTWWDERILVQSLAKAIEEASGFGLPDRAARPVAAGVLA